MSARLLASISLAAIILGSGCAEDFTIGGASASESGESSSGTSGDGDGDGDDGSCQVNCDDEREICDVDQCLCRDGLARCGDACVDTESDPTNCGTCDTDCGTDVCESGECRAGECQESEHTDCDGACVDTESDPLHCNGCDRPCQADELCIEANCREFEPGDCSTDDDCDDGRKCCPLEEGETMLCIDGGECP